MSQKVAKKAGVPDEKEKRQADSPVKDMKKKVAANAEKEKQAADKSGDKPEKVAEKVDKPAEKTEKDKPAEKKAEKSDKKAETVPEKKDDAKEDKAAKPEKQEQKAHKSKQNGNARVNGAPNGDEHNGTVSAPDDDEELMDEDEMFPELAYDSSDPEFEPDAPPRSFTRRSQAKVTRTPETPRPASDKQADPAADDSKESKVLKLKEDVPSTDRKLRSADSPKPQEPKKPEKQESGKKTETQEKDKVEPAKKTESPSKQEKEKENDNKGEKENADAKTHLEVVVEVEGSEEEPRKPDTNFSKSRVKVSPYRRSGRLADQTTSSVMANYTGNNTTMEMDITESSSFVSEDPSLDDSSYLSGLRNIRGRRSYKPLKEMALRHVAANSARTSANISACEQPSRPTGTVVGRKRKPDHDTSVELATDAASMMSTHGKRMRLLDRLFRRHDGNADIVGINTDLPLTAPVASAETFDPETLKNIPALADTEPVAVPLAHTHDDRDSKRCVLM